MKIVKNISKKSLLMVCMGLVLIASPFIASPLTAADNSAFNARIGLVNFKEAIEKSKVGKQEQEMFESMKKQIESIMSEKEQEFTKIQDKLKDDDFRDSQKPEALEKLEQQYRQLGQELAQAQSQYYQAMQQANFKILQKLSEYVSKASDQVAKEKGLDVILNDDNAFFSSTKLDVTDAVVSKMDLDYQDELKQASNPGNAN